MTTNNPYAGRMGQLEEVYAAGWQAGYEGRRNAAERWEAGPEQTAYEAGLVAGDKCREAANARAEARMGC